MTTCSLLARVLCFSVLWVAVSCNDPSIEEGGGLRRSGILDRKFFTEVANGRKHAISEVFPTRLHDPTAFDEASLSTSFDAFDEVATDRKHRKTVAGSTELRIENDCGDGLYFVVWVERPPYGHLADGVFVMNKGQTPESFPGLVSPIFYIYAMIPGELEWEDENSGVCLYGSYCGLKVDLGSLDYDVFTFTLQCPGHFDKAPSPGPTPLPTPSPTPLSTPQPTIASLNSLLDGKWLYAHNIRRQTHHLSNGVGYVPLAWNSNLAVSAQTYAEKLIDGFDDCHIEHGYEGDSFGGENLYSMWTRSSSIASGSWVPDPPNADAVLRAWYEEEEYIKPWTRQLHRTQVAWRGTQLVGCGQAQKIFGGNGDTWCSIHVCRYIAPGNCNVNENNYLDKVFDDFSPCGPFTA